MVGALPSDQAMLRAVLEPFAAFADPTRRSPASMTITAGSMMAKKQLTMGDCYAAANTIAACFGIGGPPPSTIDAAAAIGTIRDILTMVRT